MKSVPYGSSNKLINRIGFGGWQLGNNENWDNMSFAEGVNLIKYAFAKGVRLFDTAPNYAGGMSEKIIGEALKDVRNEVVINSKVGHLASGATDFSIASLESQVRMSLERLQTDYLDSVILHNPGMEIVRGDSGHYDELRRMKQRGLINAYGVSIDTYDELQLTLENTDVQVIELLFNIFFQETRPLMPMVKAKNIALLIKVPLDSGWLTGKYKADSVFTGIRMRWDRNTIVRRAALVDKIKTICGEDEITHAALAFILSFDAVTAVIPGIRNKPQLDSNLAAEAKMLGDETIERLIELYESEIKNYPLAW